MLKIRRLYPWRPLSFFSSMCMLLCTLQFATGRTAVAQDLLTLEQAIAEARQNNPELKAVRLQSGFAKATKIESYLPFPSALEMEYEFDSDRRFANEGEKEQRFAIRQEIAWPLPYLLRMSIARLNLQISDALIYRQLTLTSTFAAEAYYTLLAAQERLKASDAILELNRQLAGIAEQRFRAGDIAELDYNLVVVEKERSEAENLRFRQEVESARIAFNRLIGRDVTSPTVAAPDTSLVPVPFPEGELDAAALSRRGDFKAAELSVRAANRALQMNWASLVPNPHLFLAWRKSTVIFNLNNSNVNLSGEPQILQENLSDIDKSFAWGIGISLPLANFNLWGSQVKRAKTEKQVAEARREVLRSQVSAEVRDAYQQYQKAVAAYYRYRRLLPRLSTNIELLQQAFQSGQIDLTALLFQQDRLNRTRIDYWDAFLNAQKARNVLERAVGGLPGPGENR